MNHKNFIGHAIKILDGTESQPTDIGEILTNLLLFEKYTLHSIRLREIPDIVKTFGIEDTIQLIKSNSFEIYLDSATTAQTGQATILKSREQSGALPLLSYSFDTVDAADRKNYISRCFDESVKPIKAPIKDLKKLKLEILNKIKDPSQDINTNTAKQINSDLVSNNPILKASLANILLRDEKIEIPTLELELKTYQISDNDFSTESNLQKKFNFEKVKSHKIIERALLNVAGLNRRIAEMEHFKALSTFNYNDLPIYEKKLEFLLSPIDPTKNKERASRVFSTLNLPDLQTTEQKINIQKFLEIRESKECIEFRDWIKTIDTMSDAEIQERTLSFSSKVSAIAHTKTAKSIRFITTNAIGLIPVAGMALGPMATILDNYLFNRVIKESPIATFAQSTYPSIFKH